MPVAVKINCSSENFAGVHPQIMEALVAANHGNVPSYGGDAYTRRAIDALRDHFGSYIDVHFTFNGTGANNFGLACVTDRYSSVFCSDIAHLYLDESTAPETFTGCRLYPVQSVDGKIVLSDLVGKLTERGVVHHPQAGIVSLTQPTEYGTVYTMHELKSIRNICSLHGLLLHVDGARFFNAAARLELPLGVIVAEAGIDVLTLGGTKAGLMFGEAVIFFNGLADTRFRFHLKRSMQLASKTRFIAAQFSALLSDNLWRQVADHTNSLAQHFARILSDIPAVSVAYPVETNSVFVNMSRDLFDRLQDTVNFYYWNEQKMETRFVFSFNNTMDEVEAIAAQVRRLL